MKRQSNHLKTKLIGILVMAALQGLTACSSNPGLDAETVAETVQAAPATGPDQGVTAPVQPPAPQPPPVQVTCYRYAFVSDRNSSVDDVFFTDTCTQEAPRNMTFNQDEHTVFS